MRLHRVVTSWVLVAACLAGCAGQAPTLPSRFTLAAHEPAGAAAPALTLLDGVTAATPAHANVFDGYVGNIAAFGPLAAFGEPSALAFTPDGRLYISDGPCIRAIAPDAQGRDTSSIVAGSDLKFGADDGPVFKATFRSAAAMAGLPDGSLLFSDGYSLRRIVFDGRGGGVVTTIAGADTPGYADGPGADARFERILGLAVAADGTIYAADASRVRRIALEPAGTATVTTHFTGDARGPMDPFTVERVAVAPSGAVWVSGPTGLRRLAPTADGPVPDLVVLGTEPSDRPGEAAGEAFTRITGLAFQRDGSLLVVDNGTQPLVRRITLDDGGQPRVSTLARPLPFAGPTRYSSWLDAGLSQPTQIAVGPSGEIRVLDQSAVRAIDVAADGVATPRTYAGWPLQKWREEGPIAATAVHPDVIVPDGRGGYYVGAWNELWAFAIGPMGEVNARRLAGRPELGRADGPGDEARFDMINGLLRLPDGGLIVSEQHNGLLRRVTFDAEGRAAVTTLAGGGSASYDVESLTAGDGPALGATIAPNGPMCLGPDGTIYFADRYRVRKLARDGDGALRVTSLAGMAKIEVRIVDGPGAQARFGSVGGMTLDASGALVVVDSDNHLIRRLTFDDAGDATVETIAGLLVSVEFAGIPGLGDTGRNWLSGFKDGPGAKAFFESPLDVDLAEDGSLLVTDFGNHAIRRVARDAAGAWQVTTLIGTGAWIDEGMRDGPLAIARLIHPSRLEPDGPGRYLLVERTFPNRQLRTIRMGIGR